MPYCRAIFLLAVILISADGAAQVPVQVETASNRAVVFSNDIDVAMRLYKALDASAVMINDHAAFRTRCTICRSAQ